VGKSDAFGQILPANQGSERHQAFEILAFLLGPSFARTSAGGSAMETSSTATVTHAPQVGRDMHARLAGDRPNQDSGAAPFWGEDGFTFGDLLDLINPLQHIPLVGSLYRSMTGDEIAPGPRLLGAAVFSGGPIGAAISMTGAVVNIGIEQETGKDIGGHVLAMVGIDPAGDPVPGEAPIAVAEVSGLPWLTSREPPRNVPEAAPEPVQMAAASVPPQPIPVQVATKTRPEAAPPTVRELASTGGGQQPVALPTSSLSEEQWAMLVASVDQDSATPAQASPLPHPSSAAPRDLPAPPADVAATMARALDRYQAISRDRGL
jgi:hypothetical protein